MVMLPVGALAVLRKFGYVCELAPKAYKGELAVSDCTPDAEYALDGTGVHEFELPLNGQGVRSSNAIEVPNFWDRLLR
jgi:hypothetical protein